MAQAKLIPVSEDTQEIIAERIRESKKEDEQKERWALCERLRVSTYRLERRKGTHALKAFLAALALVALLIYTHYKGLFPSPETYRTALAMLMVGATFACLVLEIRRAYYYGSRAAHAKAEHDILNTNT